MSHPIPYLDSVERPRADEAETIEAIVAAMSGESDTTEKKYGHALRTSHAKSTALLKGSLEVLPDLPAPLAQGLFARPGTYDVLVRFAQGPGELLSDKISTHRGMAIKVLGVRGEKLAGHAAETQDFVLASGKTFPQSGAETFLRAIRGIAAGAKLPDGVRGVVSDASRGLNAAYRAVTGGDSATLDFFGHTPRHPLTDPYYSQAALRHGDHVAKIGAFAVSPEVLALGDGPLDLGGDEDGFRTAMVDFFSRHGATFELRAQLNTDLDAMPVEDASAEWPEDQSPYVAVARITLPSQAAHSEARAAYFTDRLAFRPAHSLAAHRPLGSLMRARLKVYGAMQALRARHNAAEQKEPADLSEVPD